ncbi:hypothetical protein SLA2020_098610 [Shorea laevis]
MLGSESCFLKTPTNHLKFLSGTILGGAILQYLLSDQTEHNTNFSLRLRIWKVDLHLPIYSICFLIELIPQLSIGIKNKSNHIRIRKIPNSSHLLELKNLDEIGMLLVPRIKINHTPKYRYRLQLPESKAWWKAM